MLTAFGEQLMTLLDIGIGSANIRRLPMKFEGWVATFVASLQLIQSLLCVSLSRMLLLYVSK